MRVIAPQKPLLPRLSGIHVLDDVKGHKIKPLAIRVTEEIDAEYPEAGEGFKAADGNHAIFIKNAAGDIVSFIIWIPWELEDDDHTAWIGTAWTHADYRGQGLYRELYQVMKVLAKENNLPSLGAGVNARNEVSRKTHEALGMIPTVLYYTEKL